MRTLCGTILAAAVLSVFAREPNYDEAKVAPSKGEYLACRASPPLCRTRSKALGALARRHGFWYTTHQFAHGGRIEANESGPIPGQSGLN